MAESPRVRLGVQLDMGSGRDGPRDHSVPMLSQEQYRFLRFLFRMADELGIEEGDVRAARSPAHDSRRRYALSRMRAAVSLFEPSEARYEGGGESE